jgi:lipoate-protein ligase A
MNMFNIERWRLVISEPARGAWNMAVDEAILESQENHTSLPTLRLYAWEPACLSLGVAQPFSDVDRDQLERYGWDVVRRPTGGRAVLHTDELTYSVIAPSDEPRVIGGVLESYYRLARALVKGLHLLGIEAEMNEGIETNQGRNTNAVCFEVPSTYEITFNRKKLIGSAQARRKEGVLQHGSLPLKGDLGRILKALVYPDEQRRILAEKRLLDKAITVEAVLKRDVSWNEAAQAMVRAFEEVLDINFQPGTLTSNEETRAQELVRIKYANPQWTRKEASEIKDRI